MNGWKTWDHWQTALWLSNDEGLYAMLQEVAEQGVYRKIASLADGVDYIMAELPEQTPDGGTWQREVVASLLAEEYNEMLQYS